MNKPATLNMDLVEAVKQAFVPMPGGQAEPVAGAGPMTAGLAAPMGGAPMDPSMGGMPMDPSMGGAPMDPSMGGMPMDPSMGGMPMDPAMLAGALGGEAGPADGQVTIPFSQLLELIAVLTEGSVEKSKAQSGEKKDAAGKAGQPSSDDMLRAIYQAVTAGGM